MEISMHVPFEYFPPHFSMQSFPFVLDGLNSAMNFIYPDRVDGLNSSMNYIYPDMDLVQSIDVNLRHKNTKKYKRFNRQTNNLKKEWEGNTITSYSGMCDIIGKYQIIQTCYVGLAFTRFLSIYVSFFISYCQLSI